MPDRPKSRIATALYRAGTGALSPLASRHLQRRVARGKEDPSRWREKLGEASAVRPDGALVWLHAVGLGEVMALRGLVAAIGAVRSDARFLITSTSLGSATALAGQMPARSVHQFLPLDIPGPRRRFFDHWSPDLAIWAEQDLWPGLVDEAMRRRVPLALVNARMNAEAFARRRKVRRLLAEAYAAFCLIDAQDAETARHLTALGASGVTVSGSLKPAAPPLDDRPAERAAVARTLADRRVWLAASTHPEDERMVLAAHRIVRARDPDALLILAPRRPDRGAEVGAAAREAGFAAALRSGGGMPVPGHACYVADTLGEMGLWYRLCPVAFMGGTMGPVEGHNPWEAVRLGTEVLHGPRTGNFAADYAELDAAAAALLVETPEALADAISGDTGAMADRARSVAGKHDASIGALAARLVAVMEDGRG